MRLEGEVADRGVQELHIVVCGISHKTAPIEIREKLAFTSDQVKTGLRELVSHFGGNHDTIPFEGVILSTCNRTELYVAVEDAEAVRATALRLFEDLVGFPAESFVKHCYLAIDEDAVSHLFSVAASIDSLVVGESQIQGQVRNAFELAAAEGTTGSILSRLFRQAIRSGKRARTETRIGESAVSVSSVAVELSKSIFGELGSCKALLVGAGETSELAAKSLIENGVAGLIVANRTPERAMRIAENLGGEGVGLDRVARALCTVDIAISSTDAPSYVIDANMVRNAVHLRHGKPLFMIDLAVPRDIDPAVQRIDHVYLYNIDDLTAVVQANTRKRQREVVKVQAIVREEVVDFMAWMETLHVVPTIVSLQERAESIRQHELGKAFRKMSDLSTRDQNIIAALTSRIVNKLLHDPIVCLKKHAEDTGSHVYLEVSRELFGLVGRDSSDPTGGGQP